MPTYTDESGLVVTYYVWPVDQPVGIAQIVHGVGEHALRHRELAEALNAAGYAVYADDHLGHGQTGLTQHHGDRSKLGRLGAGGLRAAVRDVHQLSGIIRSAHPELPLVLLGHSWGSFMAQAIVNDHADEYAAIVLSGTAYRMPGYLDGGDLNRRHKKLGTTGAEWLSRDPAVAEAFVADPITTSTPLARLFGLREAARLYGRPARNLRADLPILMLVGSDDTVGGERSALKLLKAYAERSGLRDLHLIVYDGARHEVFHETNRVEVFADLVAWLAARVPGSQPGATGAPTPED
ncbi:alpha/beta fold hydrolase [Cryobacterium psychrophilum]|uniref:Alpha/beta fold hydrolase n=1 Tax=Cryobacterium psychrophilum TaxID=41988 RepID=A0A4Y8KPB5_9MICO|nr:alpha/beta fold hydrolase [Cryobacterium psychrophilum]TDW30322.1 alpha-beta hydrolase superfamily lysophospholipase [Cryobacterium psychrophilum]TFD77535.1 alpha/beta fold hydrolase [Cryobacterium psychrophilum]